MLVYQGERLGATIWSRVLARYDEPRRARIVSMTDGELILRNGKESMVFARVE